MRPVPPVTDAGLSDAPFLSPAARPAPGRLPVPPSPADPVRLRPVHRAIAELRRGTAVRLEGEAPLLVAAVEGASVTGLSELASLAAGPTVLLVSAVRAAALLGLAVPASDAPAALALPPGIPDPSLLRRLADPGALPAEPGTGDDGTRDGRGEGAWRATPLPPLAGAALALAKLSRLLPAVVAAPAGPIPGGPDVPGSGPSGPDPAGLSSAGSGAAGEAATGLIAVAAADVLAFPAAAAAALSRVAEAVVPLEDAPEARLVAFRAPDGGVEHLALLVGRPEERDAPLVRLHSECFTGDFLGSLRCDCGPQLRQAIRRMAAEGAGCLLYLAQEGRGIGLVNKLRAYGLQDRGLDTLDANRALGWEADERSFLVAATMLEQLGLRRVRLLTNNPDKVAALSACGIEVAGRLSHAIVANGVNDSYLATKARRFGHLLG